MRDVGVGRKTEKVISHWLASLQCDNCFMNPPSIFTLLFSFGSFVCRYKIEAKKLEQLKSYLDNITLSNVDDGSQTLSAVESIDGSINLENKMKIHQIICQLTWSKPLNVWVMKGSKAISPLITVCTSLGTSVLDFQPPKAVPFQFLPVTSWNGLVEISFPAAATPITQDSPQPR